MNNIEPSRKSLIDLIKGKRNLSQTQYKRILRACLEHEETVINDAKLAIEQLKHDFPLLEQKLYLYEQTFGSLDGKFIVDTDPSKSTKKEIVEKAQKIEISDLISSFMPELPTPAEDPQELVDESKD